MFRYRPDIDGLRAVGVLAVIVSHVSARLMPGGFTGVDIFFVISGFVVTASLLQHDTDGAAGFILGFYSRRVRRIVPALVACMAGVFALTALFIPPAETEGIYRTGLFAIVGLSNVQLIAANNDYFALAQQLNPFTHTWSLGVEEQFYLVLPVLLWVTYRVTKSYRATFVILLTAVFASMAGSAVLTTRSPAIAYYFMGSRFWELGAGALLLLALRSTSPRPARMAGWPYFLAQGITVCVLLCSLFLTPTTHGFPFPYALAPVLGTVLYILLGHANEPLLNRVLSARPFVWIGRLSYSLYLWHWPIMTVMRWTTGLDSTLKVLACLVLIGVASVISYIAVEQPFRRARHVRAAVLIPLAAAVALAIGVRVAGAEKMLDRGYLFQEMARSIPPNHLQGMRCHDTRPRDYRGCFTPVRSPETPHAVFVVGDSHALMHMPMLQEAAARAHVELLLLTGGPLLVLGDDNGADADVQNEWGALLAHFAQHLRPGDLVVTSIARNYLYDDPEHATALDDLFRGVPVNVEAETASAVRRIQLNLQRLIDIVSLRHAALLLIGDGPMLRSDAIAACLLQQRMHWANLCDVPLAVSQKHAEPLTRAFEAAARQPGVFFWNPHDLLCRSGVCGFGSEADVLYFDRSHITRATSLSLLPAFHDFVVSRGLMRFE